MGRERKQQGVGDVGVAAAVLVTFNSSQVCDCPKDVATANMEGQLESLAPGLPCNLHVPTGVQRVYPVGGAQHPAPQAHAGNELQALGQARSQGFCPLPGPDRLWLSTGITWKDVKAQVPLAGTPA